MKEKQRKQGSKTKMQREILNSGVKDKNFRSMKSLYTVDLAEEPGTQEMESIFSSKMRIFLSEFKTGQQKQQVLLIFPVLSTMTQPTITNIKFV